MPALAEVEANRKALDDLTTLAIRDLSSLWDTLDPSDAARTAAALEEALPALVRAYGLAAATLAADWYEELRIAANAPGTFATKLADPIPDERAQALARWAVGPLFTKDSDSALAFARLAGGVQRAVANANRDTVVGNIAADPGSPVYARHASANACAFCAMLASRSAVYTSEAAAISVVGRGTERIPGKDYSRDRLGRLRSARNTPQGIRARGSRGMGSKYHDHCHCIAVPYWPGQEVPRSPLADRWSKAYTDATHATAAPGEAIDVSKVLAHMRGSLGTN